MRRVGLAALLALATALIVSAQGPAAPLSEVESLKLQLHDARVALAQKEAQLNACLLVQDRAKVTGEILKDRPGFEIDWKTLALVPVTPPAPPKKEVPK